MVWVSEFCESDSEIGVAKRFWSPDSMTRVAQRFSGLWVRGSGLPVLGTFD